MSPLDLHVLGTPPAFVLSQDQTLMFNPLPFHPRQRTIWRFALQNLTVICHSSLYRFQGSRPSCQSLARACLSLDGLISIPKKSHFVKPFSNKVISYFNPLHIALLLSFFLPNIRFYSVTSLRKYLSAGLRESFCLCRKTRKKCGKKRNLEGLYIGAVYSIMI